jgi:hypothetical protein
MFDFFGSKENEKKFDLLYFYVVQPFKNLCCILYKTFSKQIMR